MQLDFHATTASRQKVQEDKEEGPGDEGAKRKRSKNKKHIDDAPHRIERLARLGVTFAKSREHEWEEMFQRLLVYREEMGTLRFPSDDVCAASGDSGLVALQSWVKAQVAAHRKGKRQNPEATRRLREIGFDFEKWYAKPGRAPASRRRRAKETEEAEREVEVTHVGIAAGGVMEEEEGRMLVNSLAADSGRGDVKMDAGGAEAVEV